MSIDSSQLIRAARISTGADAPTLADIARGVSHAEFMLPADVCSSFDLASARLAENAIRLKDAGLGTAALNLPHESTLNLAAADARLREQAIDNVVRIMDLASSLGAHALTISAGAVMSNDGSRVNRYEDAFGYSIKSMTELRFEAAVRCIRIACRIGHAGFLLSPVDTRMWIDAVNSPWVGGRFDPIAIAESGCPADWMLTLGHRIFILDIGDSGMADESASHRPVDWPALLRIGRDINNQILVSVSSSTVDLEALAALDQGGVSQPSA